MSLDLLTSPQAVHAAMDEFDNLGSEEFLRRYGYRRSKAYFVVRNGKAYELKAIAGVAVGKEHPNRGPLRANEFSGGEATVRAKLQKLGFEMLVNKEPNGAQESEFGLEQALAIITAALGHPVASTKKLTIWRLESGRELALQHDKSGARVWIENEPPTHSGLLAESYPPEESRYSNLDPMAPRLAQPNYAWLALAVTADALRSMVNWYSGLPAAALDGDELERLKVTFLRQMPDFQSFREPGRTYFEKERGYKDALCSLFTSEVMPLVGQAMEGAEAARALVSAFHSILTRNSVRPGSHRTS